MPLTGPYPNVAAYFERLLQRPSFARAVKEGDPYRHMFPKEPN
jgi:glutathione S-transferase